MQSRHREEHSSRLKRCTAFVINTQQEQRSIQSSTPSQKVLSLRTDTSQQSQRLRNDTWHCVLQDVMVS